MTSHIDIEVAGNALTLPQDQSIDIEEQNPMFHDVEMHSYPAQLPFDYNRHTFKNLDDRDSNLRAVDVEGQMARIIVDGLPIRTSVLHVQEDEVLKDSISVNFDSRTKSFKDMISDMKCREVKVDDDIQIGEKIGTIKASFTYREVLKLYWGYRDEWGRYQGFYDTFEYPWSQKEAEFTPPALGFSYPGVMDDTALTPVPEETRQYTNPDYELIVPKLKKNFINTSKPYPEAKYCNSRICYMHHDYDAEKQETSDDIVPADKGTYTYEDYGPYWVLDARRPASGICFYVGYFLECLFKTLGVAYDISALTDIEDFNYMAFFTTACKYNENPKVSYESVYDINKWLNERGCGGRVFFDTNNTESSVSVDSKVLPDGTTVNKYDNYKDGVIYKLEVKLEFDNFSASAGVNEMFASSDNFPDATVTEVIESLEDSFGCRFSYDPEINKVSVYLLRDVFRSQKQPIHLNGHINTMYKMTEKITGVKMMYSSESDAQEQRQNIREGKRDYDTDYDYIEYPDGRTVIQNYKQTVSKIDATDMNVYVDPNTGNAIRIKVDKDATTAKEMKPVAFEVGQFKGIEVGDCSDENEDYIEEIVSNFQPITVNDVNFRNGGATADSYQPLLVPFIDEDMEREFVESYIQNPFLIGDNEVYLSYGLRLAESYDPSSTDDGQSPLMNHDWGLAIGILRTGDGGGDVENYDQNYDGFGNWKWRDIADNYCMSSDTMDQTGMWLGKTDKANTFSLKIRAWKPFLYYTDAEGKDHITAFDQDLIGKPVEEGSAYTWLMPCADDERDASGHITKRIRSRGLADVFMSEYFKFLLDRHKYKVTANVEIAQLADVPSHWRDRYEIEGKVGYIDKLHYSVDTQKGIGEVEIDFFSI